jgi:sphinganine-1-phosphate aldolase
MDHVRTALQRPAGPPGTPAQTAERLLAALGAALVVSATWKVAKLGPKGLLAKVTDALLSSVPGAQALVDREIDGEATKAVADMFDNEALFGPLGEQRVIPESGMDEESLLAIMRELNALDCSVEKANVFAYTYTTGDDGHKEFLQRATALFANENALNPIAFPALKRFETEIVAMAATMLGGTPGETSGSVTSGGTESVMMAIKAYRDYARHHRPHITKPNVVLPRTAHPCFPKGGHYFDVEMKFIDEDPVTRLANVDAMRDAVDENTILLVGSAPQYPHGVVDPISDIAAIAAERGIPCHVDSCIGGWVLPWIKKLGEDVPDFDFSVPGVTSISADLHKYAYTPKGASVILYRSADYWKFQFFSFAGWPGGLFASPSMLGTRGGAGIAGAWATLLHLGEEGFLRATRRILETKKYLMAEIGGDRLGNDLRIISTPHSSIIAFEAVSNKLNINAVADVMEDDFEWHIERQQVRHFLFLFCFVCLFVCCSPCCPKC